MIELPRMLHHVGAQRRIVTSQAEYDQAIAEGWQHRPILKTIEVTRVPVRSAMKKKARA